MVCPLELSCMMIVMCVTFTVLLWKHIDISVFLLLVYYNNNYVSGIIYIYIMRYRMGYDNDMRAALSIMIIVTTVAVAVGSIEH